MIERSFVCHGEFYKHNKIIYFVKLKESEVDFFDNVKCCPLCAIGNAYEFLKENIISTREKINSINENLVDFD